MIGWDANIGDDNECYCVAGAHSGYSVEVFANKNDKVCGVLVYDENGNLIDMMGYIPAKAIKKELIK